MDRLRAKTREGEQKKLPNESKRLVPNTTIFSLSCCEARERNKQIVDLGLILATFWRAPGDHTVQWHQCTYSPFPVRSKTPKEKASLLLPNPFRQCLLSSLLQEEKKILPTSTSTFVFFSNFLFVFVFFVSRCQFSSFERKQKEGKKKKKKGILKDLLRRRRRGIESLTYF